MAPQPSAGPDGAQLVASIVAGPYVINCWRTFGDPLYAINVHADVYRAAEGKEEIRQSAATDLKEHARASPRGTPTGPRRASGSGTYE